MIPAFFFFFSHLFEDCIKFVFLSRHLLFCSVLFYNGSLFIAFFYMYVQFENLPHLFIMDIQDVFIGSFLSPVIAVKIEIGGIFTINKVTEIMCLCI